MITDSSILASRVDGILLVINPGEVRKDAALKVKAQLDAVGAHLIGVVLNRITPRNLKKYSGYMDYYHPYYQDPEQEG